MASRTMETSNSAHYDKPHFCGVHSAFLRNYFVHGLATVGNLKWMSALLWGDWRQLLTCLHSRYSVTDPCSTVHYLQSVNTCDPRLPPASDNDTKWQWHQLTMTPSDNDTNWQWHQVTDSSEHPHITEHLPWPHGSQYNSVHKRFERSILRLPPHCSQPTRQQKVG